MKEPTKKGYGWRFWAMFPGFCIAGLLSALDTTILSTVLPTIAHDLDIDVLYVWTINGYFLSQTAVQPLYGQIANIFGRRWPMIISVLLFALGSGLCGGATGTEMLIAGRVVQGLGGGGINVMTEIIVADLVPLRERQKMMGIIFTAFAVGTFIGPVVGGAIVERTTWRWVFYINLPLCAVTLVLLLLFLNVQHDRETTIMAKLRRIDFVGNLILIASVASILLALTWAGTTRPWSSWNTLVPLILGFLGLIGFMFFEGSKWCPEPTTPMHLFSNRTAASTYLLSFLHGLILYWASLFLPVYFQAVLEDSPEKSGIDLFACVVPMVPSAILGGIIISVTGRYKDLLVGGFVAMSIGMGLFTMLDNNTTTIVWVVFQVVLALGSGVALMATLPAILASLPESDVATATATWGFLRSFGSIWGVSIPSAVFNTRFNQLAHRISAEQLRSKLYDGGAYQLATSRFLKSLDSMPVVKAEVVSVYVDSLKLVWQVGIGLTVIGVPISLVLKSLKLRDELNTEYGFEERVSEKSDSGPEP
ncbi:Major Facilitator Superfamily protein [Tolypocladium capitatum]|uniref:Major Facilitator Superfamily protein n=1 Tax=Tolypocladium capitatum TaxID=45235 RepID=A0A2K3QD65_9HYPO|nr:Major Facilitator Superfamily protein [Tolypocladium capitatum]